MKAATPHFQKISKATLKNDCMSAYELGKKKTKALFTSTYKVCMTTNFGNPGKIFNTWCWRATCFIQIGSYKSKS